MILHSRSAKAENVPAAPVMRTLIGALPIIAGTLQTMRAKASGLIFIVGD